MAKGEGKKMKKTLFFALLCLFAVGCGGKAPAAKTEKETVNKEIEDVKAIDAKAQSQIDDLKKQLQLIGTTDADKTELKKEIKETQTTAAEEEMAILQPAEERLTLELNEAKARAEADPSDTEAAAESALLKTELKRVQAAELDSSIIAWAKEKTQQALEFGQEQTEEASTAVEKAVQEETVKLDLQDAKEDYDVATTEKHLEEMQKDFDKSESDARAQEASQNRARDRAQDNVPRTRIQSAAAPSPIKQD